ncbi:hypothetical protein [Ferrimicrobium acidiphilum]
MKPIRAGNDEANSCVESLDPSIGYPKYDGGKYAVSMSTDGL